MLSEVGLKAPNLCLCEVALCVSSFQTDVFTFCCCSSFTLTTVMFLRFFSMLLCVDTAVSTPTVVTMLM